MSAGAAVASPAHRGRVARVWRRVRRNRLGAAALVVIGLVTLAAVLAPWVAPYDPDATDPQAATTTSASSPRSRRLASSTSHTPSR